MYESRLPSDCGLRGCSNTLDRNLSHSRLRIFSYGALNRRTALRPGPCVKIYAVYFGLPVQNKVNLDFSRICHNAEHWTTCRAGSVTRNATSRAHGAAAGASSDCKRARVVHGEPGSSQERFFTWSERRTHPLKAAVAVCRPRMGAVRVWKPTRC